MPEPSYRLLGQESESQGPPSRRWLNRFSFPVVVVASSWAYKASSYRCTFPGPLNHAIVPVTNMFSLNKGSPMDPTGGHDQYAFVADLYDYVVPYRTRPDIHFFVGAAQSSGGSVLEVGCGTGRILIPTARAGVDIVGLDLSPHMLQVCQTRLLTEPEAVQSRVRLTQADMRNFDLAQTFS